MRLIQLVAALAVLLFFLPIAFAEDTENVKVIHTNEDGTKTDITKDNHKEVDNDSENTSKETTTTGFEPIENDTYIQNEISAGNTLFVKSVIEGLYEDMKSNPTSADGEQGGILFSLVTFVPNPYEDSTITELYGSYLNLILYAIVIFVLGELISRSLARSKITDSYYHPQFKYKQLSGYRFVGGIAVCGFALIANVFYWLSLEIIESINEYITIPIIPNLAVNPDNLLLLGLMAVCDLLLVGFFIIRFFIIYIVAVLCGVLAFLLVPEFTRDFAENCIEKIIRLLTLQPAALAVTAIGIAASDHIPNSVQNFWYVGLTIAVFLTCWYFMFGKFTLLKTAVVFAVRKGVAKL